MHELCNGFSEKVLSQAAAAAKKEALLAAEALAEKRTAVEAAAQGKQLARQPTPSAVASVFLPSAGSQHGSCARGIV